jgi:hypothetical protein
VLVLAGAPCRAEDIRTVPHEPPPGSLRAGETVLVDDGSCPAGQIKKIVAGSDMSYRNGVRQSGTPRQVSCVVRKP